MTNTAMEKEPFYCVRCRKELTYAWMGGAEFNYCNNRICMLYGVYQIGYGKNGLEESEE